MNRFIKKIVSLVIIVACFLGGVGCTLKPDPTRGSKLIEWNGFTYRWYTTSNTYHLTGDQRKNNPELMHINPYCNGREVKYFGNTIEDSAALSGEKFSYAPSLMNVKELSIPYCMERYELLEDYPIKEVPQKIILVRNSNGDEGFITLHRDYYDDESYMREIYCSSISYEARVQYWLKLPRSWQWSEGTREHPNGEYHFYYDADPKIETYNYHFKICKANTAYMFNYENCPNDGYFFINDFEYGTTIDDAPYVPLRKGYVFKGWYKEPECINLWDFSADTLPQAQYNIEGQELYQETKLYAKWIKNKRR